MTLTRPMRDTLEHAVRQELRRVHDTQPGRPAWPAHHSTLAALVRHGLLERRERKSKRGHQLDTWTITTAGRDALKPREVLRQARDDYLDRSGATTTNPARSIDWEWQTMTASSGRRVRVRAPVARLDAPTGWRERSEACRVHAHDAGRDARKLARQIRAA